MGHLTFNWNYNLTMRCACSKRNGTASGDNGHEENQLNTGFSVFERGCLLDCEATSGVRPLKRERPILDVDTCTYFH